MQNNDLKKDLWDGIVGEMNMLSESNKKIAKEIGYAYTQNTDFLYRLNEVIVNKDKYIEDETSGLIFEKEGERYYLVFQGKDILFSNVQISEFVAKLICGMEEILPLGSVVEINNEFFSEESGLKKLNHVRVIITHRFVQSQENNHYFPYGGTIYPFGFIEQNQVFQFTPQLIKSVLHKGYQDEEDETYVYLMKKEFIQNLGKTSYAFATRKEVLEYGE